MRIRSFDVRRRNRKVGPWWDRAALGVIAVTLALLIVAVVDKVRKRDALTHWRSSLELSAGNPPWPEWQPAWPALPPSRARRHRQPQDMRGVYAYAATRAELLAQIPCFCGCAAEGHRSVLNCFLAGFRGDGRPIWTDHSFDCEMCLHIAREVMLMESRGLRADQIQAAVDSQYSRGRLRTPTPIERHRREGHD